MERAFESIGTHVHAGKCDQHSLRSNIDDLTSSGLMWGADGDSDDGDDELTQAHANGTNEEQLPASDAVDELDTDDGHDGVDNIRDNSVNNG